MFTGIISTIGTVSRIDATADARRMRIASPYDPASIAIGASIAHDGACLTIVERGSTAGSCWHEVDVSSHTLAHTTLGNWQQGDPVNLERALCAGEELGGHIVSGHVDGIAAITALEARDGYTHYSVKAPTELQRFIAPKGSVTLDGTSLTVTWVNDASFGLTLVPHTLQVTTWGAHAIGTQLNLEIDMLARYIARYHESTT